MMISLKKNKSFVVIFIIVFMLSWILGVLRFHYQWAYIPAGVLLFPFGILDITLDDYIWTHIRHPILSDEFFALFLFLLAVTGQTFIYYWIYKAVMKKRKRKKENFGK
jgi:predicted membrane protein